MRTVSPQRVRRVSEPGARAFSRFRFRSLRSRLLVAGGVVAALAVALGVYLAVPGGQPAAARYGGLPSWLPTPTVPVGRVLQASAAHPALGIEGDSVLVRLTYGQVLATAVGPQVPQQGKFPIPATTPCTFIVTFARTSGTVPVNAGAFTIIDEQGHLHAPRVTVPGGSSSGLPAGQTVTLTLSTTLPIGAGQLRWAPAGGKPIVTWDFDVEID